MKLKFTRKTWYVFLLAAAALSLLDGLIGLTGVNFSLFETAAFICAGIGTLFLAMQKGGPEGSQRSYSFTFVLLVYSQMFTGPISRFAAALVWPNLLIYECGRDVSVINPTRLVLVCEAAHLILSLAALYTEQSALYFWAGLVSLPLACARGWAAYTLYKEQKKEQEKPPEVSE